MPKVEEEIEIKNLGTEIEKLKALDPSVSYIDCTIEIATRLGVDIEDLRRILPNVIKEKIKFEALQRNMLKEKPNTLL